MDFNLTHLKSPLIRYLLISMLLALSLKTTIMIILINIFCLDLNLYWRQLVQLLNIERKRFNVAYYIKPKILSESRPNYYHFQAHRSSYEQKLSGGVLKHTFEPTCWGKLHYWLTYLSKTQTCFLFYILI